MTLDEAIKERQKVIEVQEKLYEDAPTNESKEIIKSATDNDRQLIEWLKELKEAKQLLKAAVEDISKMPCNNDTHSPDSCYICEKHGNCSYADSFKWCKADIALKLIGETNEP